MPCTKQGKPGCPPTEQGKPWMAHTEQGKSWMACTEQGKPGMPLAEQCKIWREKNNQYRSLSQLMSFVQRLHWWIQ